MYQYKSETLPTNNIKMILITSFYENPQKYEEWMYCLKQNIKNKNIKKIIYFLEGFDFIKNELDFFNYFSYTYQVYYCYCYYYCRFFC